MTRTQNKINWTVENLFNPEAMIIMAAKMANNTDRLFSAIENKSIPALREFCKPYCTPEALDCIFAGNVNFGILSVQSIPLIGRNLTNHHRNGERPQEREKENESKTTR